MENGAIHRLVEQHAASRPAATALVDRSRAMSYRELNFRANACARKLLGRGFKRGAHAVVRMAPGADLAVVLLAVLKSGGSYTWIDPRQPSSDGYPAGVSIAPAGLSDPSAYVPLDDDAVLASDGQPSPNLPVLTRPSDVACVLLGCGGAPEVLVPHATVVGMQRAAAPSRTWIGEPGALDLWVMLMSGATVETTTAQEAAVAA